MKPVALISVLIGIVTMFSACERSVGVDNNSNNDNNQNNNSAPYLEVSFSADTPEDMYIPRNAANMLYSKFLLAPHDLSDVRINSVVLTRDGLGNPDDFTEVKIRHDGVVISGPGSFDETDEVVFSDSFEFSGSFEIDAVADMNAEIGSQNRICIMAPEDLEAENSEGNPVEVRGDFPVCGNFMTTTSAVLGQVYFTQIYPDSLELTILEPDQELITIEVFNDSGEDVDITRMMFSQPIPPWDMINHKLLVDDQQVGQWDEASGSFDLSENPFYLARGNTARFVYKAEITYGLCQEFSILFYHTQSIAIGRTYGFELILVGNPNQGGSSTKLMTGRSLMVSAAAENPPAGDVARGSNDFIFLAFRFLAGTDLMVDSLGFLIDLPTGVESGLDDLKVWTKNQANEWYVVSGPSDSASWDCVSGHCTETFNDQFVLSKCSEKTFMVTMDVAMSMQTGTGVSVSLVKEEVTATDVPPENILGNSSAFYGNTQTVVP